MSVTQAINFLDLTLNYTLTRPPDPCSARWRPPPLPSMNGKNRYASSPHHPPPTIISFLLLLIVLQDLHVWTTSRLVVAEYQHRRPCQLANMLDVLTSPSSAFPPSPPLLLPSYVFIILFTSP